MARGGLAACAMLLASCDASPADELASTRVSAADISVCFTPGADCTQPIVAAIEAAKREILVQAYQMPYVRIAKALEAAAARGVTVRIVFDRSAIERRADALGYLTRAGIETLVDEAVPLAHNKVMVIDGTVVITGSFNFTHAAAYDNAENVLIVRSAALADSYRRNWLDRHAVAHAVIQ